MSLIYFKLSYTVCTKRRKKEKMQTLTVFVVMVLVRPYLVKVVVVDIKILRVGVFVTIGVFVRV